MRLQAQKQVLRDEPLRVRESARKYYGMEVGAPGTSLHCVPAAELVVVVVEPFTGFASQIAAGNHVAHELWRAKPWAELAFQVLGNVEAYVNTDDVGECQRADRVFVAQNHRVVDIFGRGNTFFDHADGFQAEG